MRDIVHFATGCSLTLVAGAVGWFIVGSIFLFAGAVDMSFGSPLTVICAGLCAFAALMFFIGFSRPRPPS